MMINVKQIKKIHTLIHLLKLNDDAYKAMLDGQYQVSSSKELSSGQAGEFIQLLESQAIRLGLMKKPFDLRQKYSELGENRGIYASPKQLRMIDALWTTRSREKTNESLNAFIYRIVGIKDIKEVEKPQVEKIVMAIKGLKRGKGGSR